MAVIKFKPPEEDLRQQLALLQSQLAQLDAAEPLDEESDEYELWSQEHEDLEDQIDDILDLLD